MRARQTPSRGPLSAGSARRARAALCACLCLLALAACAAAQQPAAAPQPQVSRLGDYKGYSRPVYSEWQRASLYVKMRDGVRLAVDLFRPAVNGQPVEEPLPVIWTYDRYHRATLQGGRLVTQLDQEPWLKTMLSHGYVVGVADVRGTGASFGTWEGPFTPAEAQDGYDLTEWFAAQPWSNKRVGMFGRSYPGITQYLTAAMAPPHLKAIFPEMAMFDLYSFAYNGGVFSRNFASNWNRMVSKLDTETLAAPVDDDRDGALLREAVAGHVANANVYETFAALPFRDSRGDAESVYARLSPARFLKEVGRSRVAIYHLSGWNDVWPRDVFLWFGNLDNPQKLLVGPWSHGTSFGLNLAEERLRWFDFWLKGVDNRVMSEPPIHYFTTGAARGQEWAAAEAWPPKESRPATYYFRGGAPGQTPAPKSGLLSPGTPAEPSAADSYTADYAATSGVTSRWANAFGAEFGYPDMAPNDARGMAYTSPPLEAPLEVTGHPVVHLWVSAAAKDADFFVYLEEVNGAGVSRYVTEGALRASHRAVAKPPYNYLGLPYHPSTQREAVELTGEPAELALDLLPTSYIFEAGNRIRVTVVNADKDNFETPALSPPPVINIHRDAAHASRIVLPVIQNTARAAVRSPAPPQPQTPAAEGDSDAPPYTTWAGVAAALALFLVLFFSARKSRRWM